MKRTRIEVLHLDILEMLSIGREETPTEGGGDKRTRAGRRGRTCVRRCKHILEYTMYLNAYKYLFDQFPFHLFFPLSLFVLSFPFLLFLCSYISFPGSCRILLILLIGPRAASRLGIIRFRGFFTPRSAPPRLGLPQCGRGIHLPLGRNIARPVYA